MIGQTVSHTTNRMTSSVVFDEFDVSPLDIPFDELDVSVDEPGLGGLGKTKARQGQNKQG
jgi:hypothetical protein